MEWLQPLLPLMIPLAIQAAKALGLKNAMSKPVSRLVYPLLAVGLGAASGAGFAGEASMAMAALEGAGITGLASIGIHSATKSLLQAFAGMGPK